MEREGTHNYYLVTPSYSMVFFSDQRAKYIFQEGSKLSKLNIFPQNFCFQGFFEFIIYDSEVVASGNMFPPRKYQKWTEQFPVPTPQIASPSRRRLGPRYIQAVVEPTRLGLFC